MEFIFDNERPIYVQLKEQIKVLIISGYFNLGSRLPSVRELALTIKVNPNTIQKALSELEDEKLIFTERTNGKYVTNDSNLIEAVKRDLAKEKVFKYLNDMSSIGITFEEACIYLQELGGKKWVYYHVKG